MMSRASPIDAARLDAVQLVMAGLAVLGGKELAVAVPRDPLRVAMAQAVNFGQGVFIVDKRVTWVRFTFVG